MSIYFYTYLLLAGYLFEQLYSAAKCKFETGRAHAMQAGQDDEKRKREA